MTCYLGYYSIATRKIWNIFSAASSQICQQRTSGEDRTYLAGDVRADGVHQQVVCRVGLLSHPLDGPRGHRKGGDPRRADHRVDTFVLRQEEIQQLRCEYAARRVEHEGDESHGDYHKSVQVDEFFARHRRGDRESEEDGDDVGELVLRGV